MQVNFTQRKRRIAILQRRLLEDSNPRFVVSVIITLSAMAGFVTSFILLHAGLELMGVRYPISIVVAYFVFLGLLALWLWLQQRTLEPDFEILEVFQNVSIDLPDLSGGGGHFGGLDHFGGGGDFGGAGAGGSWDHGAKISSTVRSSNHSAGTSFFPDLDLDEGWLILLAIVALLGGLIATLYVVYIAPALLAEIFIDGVLVTGLYKQVKHIEQRHWLRAAVRKTIMPALLVVLFFCIAGFALQKAVPEARTMGEVWRVVIKDNTL